MTSQFLKPDKKLSGYVDNILVIECRGVTTDFVLPLYANGVPSLLFQSEAGSLMRSSVGHLTLFGQTVAPEQLLLKKDFVLIAYFFKPGAVMPLFGIRANELTNSPVNLALLEPLAAIPLQERLLNTAALTEKIAVIDEYLIKKICHSQMAPSGIEHAAACIAQNYSPQILGALQQKLGISERSFQRSFDQAIGLPPNLFRRICQFNAAFSDLNSGRFEKLSDLAYRHGYADQSHYIRAFKEFTHLTPNEFLNFGE